MLEKDLESDEKTFNTQVLDSLNKSKRLKKLISAFIKVFKNSSQTQETPRTNLIIMSATEALLFFQLTSLMWRKSMTFRAWSSYLGLWQILSYSRIDLLFTDLNYSIMSYYLFSAVIYILLFLTFYVTCCTFYKINQLKILSWLIKKLLILGSSALFFPISITLFSYFLDKFGMFQGKPAGYLASYYFLQEVNCGVCFGLHCFFTVATKVINCEVNHGVTHKFLYSKANCQVDIRIFMIDLLLVALYCFLPDNRIQILHVVCFGVKSWLCIYFCVYIPFYNEIANKIMFSRFFSEAIVAFLFGCNYFINESEFLFFSFVLIIPMCVFLSFHIISFRYSVWKGSIKTINVNLFELVLRKDLINIENPSSNIIEKFNIFKKKEVLAIGNVDILKIWESYYCFNALRDPRLAFIKLSSVNKKNFSLEIYIQELKIRNYFKENNIKELEDLSFLDYIMKLSNAKKNDREICELYFEFMGEITGKDPSKKKLKKIGFILDNKIQKLSESYKKLCEKYPNGIEVRRLYKSFCSDILCESNLILNLKIKNDQKKELNEINFFDDTIGILIISSEQKDIGRITYTNEKFASMLKTSPPALIGTDLNSLIPYPYNKSHNARLLKYSQNCTSSYLRFPGSLFLKTEKNFLVEIIFKISCISISNSIFYLVVAKELENEQICILLNPDGLIYSHSENLHLILNSHQKYFENYKIQDFVPELNLEQLILNRPVSFILNNSKWYVVKSNRTIGNVEILVLFIVKTSKALDGLIKQNHKEAMLVTKNQKPLDKKKSIKEEKLKVKFKNESLLDKNATTAVIEETQNMKLHQSPEISEISPEKKKELNNYFMFEKAFAESIRRLKIVKIIFFVFLVAITASVIANIVYLNNLIKFVQENKMKTLYMEYIDMLEQTTRLVTYTYFQIYPDENMQNMAQILINTKNLNDDLQNSIGDYKYCSNLPSSFHHKSLFFHLDYENMYKNRFTLYDAIKEYQYYMQLFLTKYNNKTSTYTEGNVLVRNGIIHLYRQGIIEMSQIDKCHDEVIDSFKTTQKYIMILQLSILLTLFLLQSWQISFFIKGSNFFWNKISQHTYNSFYNIKLKCCERLTHYLQVQEEEVQALYDLNRVKNNEFTVTYSQILGYCWRFSILFVLTGMYLGFFYSFLLNDVKVISEEKTQLINSVYLRKFSLERIENYSVLNLAYYGYFVRFSDETIQDYNKEKEHALHNSFGGLVNGILYDYFYDNAGADGFLRFGLNSAGNWIVMESYKIRNGYDYAAFKTYFEYTNATFSLFDTAISEVIKKGKSKVNSVYQVTIFMMAAYIVCCALLCALFYFPYLKRKNEKILSLQSVFTVLASNGSYRKMQSMI